MTTLATTRRVDAAGTALHVVDVAPEARASDPDAVVLSHGAGGCHLNWYHQVAEFSRDRRVVVWDQRGFGRSADPDGLASPHRAAEDLLAVLDACGVRTAWLVAQSMGGWGGSLCVRDHPDRFRGVILCDTAAGVIGPGTARRLDRFAQDSRARVETGALFSSLAVDPAWIADHRAQATALHLWSRALPATYGTAVTDLAVTHIGTDHLRGLPVGVIVGEKDPVFPPEELCASFADVADLGVHEIAGAGHSPYLERPERFNAVVRSMIQTPVGAPERSITESDRIW